VTTLRPGRLGPPDVLRLGAYGLRARPLRIVLSALGIAIGIAAMVAVVATSTSSRADLDRLLDSLGTNLLTVAPGSTLFGEQATLPDESVAMIGRIGQVESVTAIGQLPDAKVYRTNKVPRAGERRAPAAQAANQSKEACRARARRRRQRPPPSVRGRLCVARRDGPRRRSCASPWPRRASLHAEADDSSRQPRRDWRRASSLTPTTPSDAPIAPTSRFGFPVVARSAIPPITTTADVATADRSGRWARRFRL